MQRLKRTINGKVVIIYSVDEEIKTQLRTIKETGDEKLMDEYFLMISKEQLRDIANTRRHQSLEVSIEAGHQFEDEGASLDDILIEREERSKLYEAVKTLSNDQQWLVKQIYVLGKTQCDVAKELGISQPAIAKQIKKILGNLKKVLENWL